MMRIMMDKTFIKDQNHLLLQIMYIKIGNEQYSSSTETTCSSSIFNTGAKSVATLDLIYVLLCIHTALES